MTGGFGQLALSRLALLFFLSGVAKFCTECRLPVEMATSVPTVTRFSGQPHQATAST